MKTAHRIMLLDIAKDLVLSRGKEVTLKEVFNMEDLLEQWIETTDVDMKVLIGKQPT